MTRRLLFDQNLSPRLVDDVAGRFPGSLRVGDVGLSTATDVEVDAADLIGELLDDPANQVVQLTGGEHSSLR